MEVRVLSSLDSLSTTDWQELTANASVYYTREWLQAVTPDIGEQILLFTAYRSGIPVGVIPAFKVSKSTEFVYHNVREAVLESTQLAEVTSFLFPQQPRKAFLIAKTAIATFRPLLDSFLFPNLVFTSPFAYVSETLIRPNEPDPEGILDTILNSIEQYSHTQNLGCTAFLWIEATQHRLLSALKRKDYHLVRMDTAARLQIKWSSFDEYLGCFRSKQRWHIKREIQCFQDAGGHIRYHDSWSEIEEQAINLAIALQQRHNLQPTFAELANRYQRILTSFGDRAIHLTAWLDGNLVGFLTAFVHGNVLYPKHVGFDDTLANRESYVYFNLVYYKLIELALELGVREIDYGSGTHKAKRDRGCEIVPLYIAYRFQSPWMERLAKLYLPALHQQKMNHFD